ncbi:MAG TPA: kynureninase [Holosporales bacterium]|nr:kynureninase [Holosporales bacterium]
MNRLNWINFVGILVLNWICTGDDAFAEITHDTGFSSSESYAKTLDKEDPLARFRSKFDIPLSNGQTSIYFNGNSLGIPTKAAQVDMMHEMQDWAKLGVRGHFREKEPWYTYHENFRGPVTEILGAHEDELVFMNSLTVNLHMMMVSFYRPTRTRYKILMEGPVFASDTYAVKTQIEHHGYTSEEALIVVEPRQGEDFIRTEDVAAALEKHGDSIALVMMNAVNYLTGQAINVKAISELSHKQGAYIGIDLAHATGNIPLKLHDWNVDFAAWCSYKYLSGGPGAIGGVFIHERHAKNIKMPRFAGWWGNDPQKRFLIHLEKNFVPVRTADAWQISNPSIFSMVPLKGALAVYQEAGMEAFREKSVKITGYLETLLDEAKLDGVEIVTPRNPDERGCQLSLRFTKEAEKVHKALEKNNVICDFRKPNIVRAAPHPLYNTYHEVWRFVQILKDVLEAEPV